MLTHLRRPRVPAPWRIHAVYCPSPWSVELSFTRCASISRQPPPSPSGDLASFNNSNPERATTVKGTLPRRNILEQSKVQEYLDYVAANSTITLDDIERYRPRDYPQVDGKQYEADYTALLETLVRSFSAKQLQKFVELYGLDPPTKRTKWNYAASIIENRWHWPSLTGIQKQRRDQTEVSHEVFPLDASQSFLLLGKDGADLLTLSKKYNVHISLSANPLCLKVEGLRGSLDKLGQHIKNLNDCIKSESFNLPNKSHLRADILQRISHLSGVFTESIDSKTVRMSHRGTDHHALAIAKRLLIRASCEVPAQVPLYFSVPTEHPSPTPNSSRNTYSMYPFLSPQSLPWTTSTGPVFRIRKVGEWLKFGSTNSVGNVIPKDEKNMFQLHGWKTDIRTILSDYLGTSRHPIDAKTMVSASLGHLLFCSPPGQTATLSPPLRGVWEMSGIHEWTQDQSNLRIHSPSLPTALLRLEPVHERVLHRLTYSSLETASARSGPATQTLKFEIDLKDTPLNSTHSASLWAGSMGSLDLMLPDRSLDIRFSVFRFSSTIRDQWPVALEIYQTELRQFLLSANQDTPQPTIPLGFSYGGFDYYLQSTCNVRQNTEPMPDQLLPAPPLAVVRESIMDLETNQRSATCQVMCDNMETDQYWTDFLETCDRLTRAQ
ncbi:hypothetical protein BD779DRAFT_1484892 [Infundibulicybe gibba]|nr:hypothetical protein BD779DRAFT_1484892 [Infundibulicybe gibba]